jgi:hypothetical protein
MDALQITVLVMVAVGATAVVLIRAHVRQVLALSVYGVLLAILFLRFPGVVQAAAIRFEDQTGYITTVLAGAHVAHPVAPAAAESAGITVSGVLTGTGTAIGALILAFLALYWRRLPLLRRGYEPGAGLSAPIQRFQSGVINDYVTWMVLGLAVIGGVLALSIG